MLICGQEFEFSLMNANDLDRFEDANALLTDKDSLSGRIEDAGLDPADLPGCSEKNWDALQDVIDRLTPEAKGEF